MLQSAIFADLQAADVGSHLSGSRAWIRAAAARKNSYARLIAWGRALFVRDDFSSMSPHLLRDIGMI